MADADVAWPDFDQLARQTISGSEHHIARVAEQLRQVWNLRGACDIAAIDEVAHTNETAVEAAIEKLNRC